MKQNENKMKTKLTNPEKEFIEINTEIGMAMTGNPLISKIYSIIISENKEFSLDELKELTGFSLASISNSIKKIERMHGIKRIKKPGTKKVFVKANTDFIGMMEENLTRMIETKINPVKKKYPKIIIELKETLKKQNKKEDKERITNKIKLYECYLSQTKKIEETIKKIKETINK